MQLASTAIRHSGPLNRSSGRISAVHPILLFTMPFFCVPTFLPAKTLTMGRLFIGSTDQRENRLPLALPHCCPLVFTVDGEQRSFTRLSLQAGSIAFRSTLSASVGVSFIGLSTVYLSIGRKKPPRAQSDEETKRRPDENILKP
jgi:hypothetical protein